MNINKTILAILGLIAVIGVSKLFAIPIYIVAITAIIGVGFYRLGKK